MQTLKPVYLSNNNAFTITISSLTNTSVVWSSAYDNTSNQYDDMKIQGKIKTGASGTSATGYFNIRIAPSADGGTTYDSGTANTDVIAVVNVAANATTYNVPVRSLAALYGGSLPPLFKLGVENQSGGTTDTTPGNHGIWYEAEVLRLV